jgi:hypothetical protein
VRTDEKLAQAPEPVKERRAQKEISLIWRCQYKRASLDDFSSLPVLWSKQERSGYLIFKIPAGSIYLETTIQETPDPGI